MEIVISFLKMQWLMIDSMLVIGKCRTIIMIIVCMFVLTNIDIIVILVYGVFSLYTWKHISTKTDDEIDNEWDRRFKK